MPQTTRCVTFKHTVVPLTRIGNHLTFDTEDHMKKKTHNILRYLCAENLFKDFSSKSQRRAMKAMLEWLNLHLTCARKIKVRGKVAYTCNMDPRHLPDELSDDVTAYVLTKEDIVEITRALGDTDDD